MADDFMADLTLAELSSLRKRALSAGQLTDAASTLVGSYTAKLNSVNTSGVIKQSLIMSAAVGSGLTVYFFVLRPHLSSTLAPRTTQKTSIGRKIDGFVKANFRQDGYVKRVWDAIQEFYNNMTLSEQDLLLQSGMDAVAYLRLRWLSFQIFLCISLVTFPSLVPLDWKAHNKGKLLDRHNITKIVLKDFTIAGLKDNTLYYHIAAGHAVTFIVISLVWWNSRCLSRLREKFYTNPAYLDFPEDRYKRCVMIADLGTSRSRLRHKIKRKIEDILELQGIEYQVQIFTTKDPQGRAAKMEKRNKLILQLEKVVTHWLESQKEGQVPTDSEPMTRPPGLLAWSTAKIPALPYFKETLINEWENASKSNTKYKYAFISFPAAGNVSQFLRACGTSKGKLGMTGWEIDFAPTPNGIIWANVGMNAVGRGSKNLAGYGVLCFLLVVYTPPMAGIALLSNVGAVTEYSKMLSRWSTQYPNLFTITTATVPPALSAAMFSILPKIIEVIAQAQGAKTTRSLQSRTMNWYLAFMIMSQLIIFPSLSTIFSLLTEDPAEKAARKKAATGLLKIWFDLVYFFTQIPATYQEQANYWLNWLAMRWFLAVFQLAQGPLLIKSWLIRFYRHLTAREAKATKALPAEYAINIPQAMFLLALGLIYAPLVPFVSVFAMVGSLLLFIIHQVQSCILYHTESETGGRFWLPEMDRVLLFLLLSQAMLALTCALQSADIKKAFFVGPASILTIFFKFALRGRFNRTLVYMLSDLSTIKTSLEPDISLNELRHTWGFVPKGVRLVFKDDINVAARDLLRVHGLLPLVDVVDPVIIEKEKDDTEKETKEPVSKMQAIVKGMIARKRGGKRKADPAAPNPGFEDARAPFKDTQTQRALLNLIAQHRQNGAGKVTATDKAVIQAAAKFKLATAHLKKQ